jgi:RNA polymerase sigma-70 factor (ECF subfamily)
MDRYAEGEDAAFAEVYDLLTPPLLAFFQRQVGDATRAQDVVQQTLLQMHAARRNYRTGSDVIPWAFAIGRRVLVDMRRKNRKELLFPSAEDDRAARDGSVDRASVPDDVVATREMADRVRTELEHLSPTLRDAYALVRGEGLSVAETAEILGTTPTAVKLRVHRVYKVLRAALGLGEDTRKPAPLIYVDSPEGAPTAPPDSTKIMPSPRESVE